MNREIFLKSKFSEEFVFLISKKKNCSLYFIKNFKTDIALLNLIIFSKILNFSIIL